MDPSPSRTYEPGEAVVLRDVRGGVVRAISAAVVVEHTSSQLVTWIPQGSPLRLPGDVDGRVVKTDRVERLVEVPWDAWGGPLFIWPHGAWHSVRVSWSGEEDDRSVDHWYVNLHTPLRPSPYGFDLDDLVLDVMVSADRRTWAWKDEQEFAEARRRGSVDEVAAERILTEGPRVAAAARSGADPFTDRWASWRPDPSWSTPSIPSGCERL